MSRPLPIRRRAAAAGEPVARACVVGASGFAGALAAAILWRHPRVSLEAVTARTRGRPAARRPLPAPPRAARARALRRRAAGGELDVALVSYPHGAARRGGRRAARRGPASRRPVGRLPPARPRRATSAGTGRTARPSCVGEAVFGLTELHRDEIAARDLVANPGCYSTAAILALAPLARAGLIADAVVDAQERGVRRRPRGDRDARTSSPWTRT